MFCTVKVVALELNTVVKSVASVLVSVCLQLHWLEIYKWSLWWFRLWDWHSKICIWYMLLWAAEMRNSLVIDLFNAFINTRLAILFYVVYDIYDNRNKHSGLIWKVFWLQCLNIYSKRKTLNLDQVHIVRLWMRFLMLHGLQSTMKDILRKVCLLKISEIGALFSLLSGSSLEAYWFHLIKVFYSISYPMAYGFTL